MEASQRRELTQQINKSTGSYELVFGPLILALIGLALDRWLGLTPVLTIVLGVLGLVGASIKLYFGYQAEMDSHDEDAPWAKRS